MIKLTNKITVLFAILMLPAMQAWADDYSDTVQIFRDAIESKQFFDSAYGYAVFPTIGKGGLVIGGSHGKGQVYQGGKVVGFTSMGDMSIGE